MNLAPEPITFARMVRGRHPVKRANLIDLSRRWQMQHEARQREAQARAEALGRAVERFGETRVSEAPSGPRAYIATAADRHGVRVADILSTSRKRKIVEARFDAIVDVYVNCKIDGRRYSLPDLGRLFGRDHTSILSALRRRGVA